MVEAHENEYFELQKEDNEESLVRYYRGLEYKEILLLLLQNHDVQMSMTMFKRRLQKIWIETAAARI